MPEFNTYVDVDVDEFWIECSIGEKEALINLLVEDGWVVRTSPKGTTLHQNQPSLPDILWMEMINKISVSRFQLTKEEEEFVEKLYNRL
jgi:hypothetical protein